MERFLKIFKIKDIRVKLLFIAGLLVVFRFAAAVPIPGVDANQLRNFLAK